MKQEEKEIRLLMLGLDNAGAFIDLNLINFDQNLTFKVAGMHVCMAHRQDNNPEEAAT